MRTLFKILIALAALGGLAAAILIVFTPNKVPFTGKNADLVGIWVSKTGEKAVLHGDGSGDYESSSFSVTGGVAYVKDSDLIFQLGPIKKAFSMRFVQDPGTPDRLVLNNVEYFRFDPTQAGQPGQPSPETVAAICKGVFNGFASSITQKSMKPFYDVFIYEPMKKEFPLDKFEQEFSRHYGKDLMPFVAKFPTKPDTLKFDPAHQSIEATFGIVVDPHKVDLTLGLIPEAPGGYKVYKVRLETLSR